MGLTSDSMGHIKELILIVDEEIRSILIIFFLCLFVDNYVVLPKIFRMMEFDLQNGILLNSILLGHFLLISIIILCGIAIIIYLFKSISEKNVK